MTDQSKTRPIRIPINFVDTTPPTPHAEMADEDVIELGADATDLVEFRECVVADEEADAESMFAPAVQEAEAESDLAVAGGVPDDDPEVDTLEEETPILVAPLPPPVEAGGGNGGGPSVTPAALRPASDVPLEAFIRRGQEIQQKAEQIERLTAEKKELHESLLRKQADFDNFRKRSEKETQEAFRRIRGDVVLDLIPVLDNFELALLHADITDPATLREGVTLIYKQLTDILSRQGLELVAAEGQQFDPEIHEAVAIEPSDDVKDHTVLQEFQRGYRLGDRLLRPARVKVAVQPQ